MDTNLKPPGQKKKKCQYVFEDCWCYYHCAGEFLDGGHRFPLTQISIKEPGFDQAAKL